MTNQYRIENDFFYLEESTESLLVYSQVNQSIQ